MQAAAQASLQRSMAMTAINDLQVNLEVLSRLQPGQRVYIRNFTLMIEPTSVFTGLKRWFFQDNRYDMIACMEKMFQQVVFYCLLSGADPDDKHAAAIKNKAHEALRGLQALVRTYDGDLTLQSRLQVLIETVEQALWPADAFTKGGDAAAGLACGAKGRFDDD